MATPRIYEPETLSPCPSSRSRRSSDSNSPEFEFWMVRNPSFPQPNLHSADELFVDGVLLPLHLLSLKPSDPTVPNPLPDPEPANKESGDPESGPGPGPGPGPELIHVTTESANGLSSSKRWTDIFRKGDKKAVTKNTEDNKDKEKEKKRDKKSQSGVTSAELNINIWPFSRSRSAGNGGTRPRLIPGAPGTRKVSSAPCSRSNSAGESKSRKWPSSPGRPGVHLGRSSPIWQVKRGGGGLGGRSSETLSRNGEKVVSKKEVKSNKAIGNGSTSTTIGKMRVLNMNVNVPMCIGYRHHLSCRSDENGALGVVGAANNKSTTTTTTGTVSGGTDGGHGHVTNNGNLFNFRSLFSKKVY
ncbi:uncharacterized protein LOC123218792 [Mangifera indica]|uniref:uncharacterized protein LOC123218792 n=1 Tax=Mangifera indica TaxID=29780 RepID=UPI001CFC21CD|nr:uncharacterized protein LOC123218792 [Mangifera indica]